MFTQILSMIASGSQCQAAAVEFAPFALVVLPYVLLILVSVVLIKIR